ncbi:MAG: bifunctional methylenetetrahydrofolate dehydrogenase/methenyltetrahydrofolate cyclohydrolase [Betaproteobacteria bacterium RIFCSPLOWO2_02_FULL_66_14]|nr:MAG: bifunctional methylenetetrahydrofolate dehydrogenase/methenyltetrahydrofolate cyclohydrolase [Betaproteobacteria bacterium RIFCSPLOWO2_02_FULL_66_14]
MTAKIIDGKAIAAALRAEIKRDAQALLARGVQPGLAVILVGDDPASRIYVRNKSRAGADTGVRSTLHEFAADAAESAVLERIANLNADPGVHGILVQLPLPARIRTERVIAAIAPAKDVDGFHPLNLGALVAGHAGFVPCTPAGVMHLLAREGVPLAGRNAVVIGRSNIVGKPMALLLLRENATVTVCHSKTADLPDVTRRADVLIAAVGRARMVTANMVKPGACVVDVGINRLPDGSLAGDVDFAAVREVAASITPVPGGVGPMTVALLIANTVRAAARAAGMKLETP